MIFKSTLGVGTRRVRSFSCESGMRGGEIYVHEQRRQLSSQADGNSLFAMPTSSIHQHSRIRMPSHCEESYLVASLADAVVIVSLSFFSARLRLKRKLSTNGWLGWDEKLFLFSTNRERWWSNLANWRSRRIFIVIFVLSFYCTWISFAGN